VESNSKETINNLDFLNEKAIFAPGRLKDICVFVFFNLHWFILGAVIGAGISYYCARVKPRAYRSSARIMLKSGNMNRNGAGDETAIMNGVAHSYYYSSFSTTLNNEILIITSKSSIAEMARRLNLNVDYTMATQIVRRTKNLYGESPFTVTFLDLPEEGYAEMSVTLTESSRLSVECDGYAPVEGQLDSLISTPAGRIRVSPTWFNSAGYAGIPIKVVHSPLSRTVSHYRNAVKVEKDEGNNSLINVTLVDNSPTRAADVINTLVKVYNDDSMEDKTRIIENTYDFINQRVAQLDADLGNKNGQLASFKRANQIIDINSLGQTSLANKAAHSEEAERITRQISLARYAKEALSKADDSAPVMVVFDDPTIAAEVSRYNEAAIKFSKYDNAGASQNPMVIALSNELRLMRENITSMLDTYVSTLSSRLSEARNAESLAVQEIHEVPSKQLYVDDIERLQEVKSALYLNLLNKREELLISQPSIEPAARVIDEAVPNGTPVSPNSRRMIIVGILLGLLAPALVMFIRRVLDTRVRFRSDIEHNTNAPFIGEVPSLDKKDKRHIVMVDNGRDLVSEAFRLLRYNVSYMRDASKTSNVFLMTSMQENSGKTFIVSNLAASYALTRKSVIVLDMDLRKGTLTHNVLGRKHGLGVSDWLSGSVTALDSIVVKDVLAPGVDIISSGHLPPNPAELVYSSNLESLMEALRARYEYIFIDCVPSNIVADSDIIKRIVDTTLFIVRSGRFDKRDLPGLQFMYESHKFPNMGVILNGIEVAKHRGYGYGYGYGYGSGYGYGYGYGYGSAKKYGTGHGYGYGYGYGDADDDKPQKKAFRLKKENKEANKI